jgi:hypothetical protein
MPYCPYCHSDKMIKFGRYRYSGSDLQRYFCKNCRGVTAYPKRRVPRKRRRITPIPRRRQDSETAENPNPDTTPETEEEYDA